MLRSHQASPREYHQVSSTQAMWSDGIAFRGPRSATDSRRKRRSWSMGSECHGNISLDSDQSIKVHLLLLGVHFSRPFPVKRASHKRTVFQHRFI
jgi:hypothetical protein